MNGAVHQNQGKTKRQGADGDTDQHKKGPNQLEGRFLPVALPARRSGSWYRRLTCNPTATA
jgi:hypothetical protein